MKITTAEDYSLRALAHLAKHAENPTSLSTIAEQEKLPLAFLEQLFVDLKKAKLVKAHRGAKGGYTLSQSPDRISTKDVLEAVSGPLSIIDCNHEYCPGEDCCPTRGVWMKLKKHVSDVLSDITLADLIS